MHFCYNLRYFWSCFVWEIIFSLHLFCFHACLPNCDLIFVMFSVSKHLSKETVKVVTVEQLLFVVCNLSLAYYTWLFLRLLPLTHWYASFFFNICVHLFFLTHMIISLAYYTWLGYIILIKLFLFKEIYCWLFAYLLGLDDSIPFFGLSYLSILLIYFLILAYV